MIRSFPFTGDIPKVPVVALSGRSNVGKSSLLNRVLGTRVAAVSRRPGRTRAIHLYEDAAGFLWADMPGYGYAAAAHAQRRQWLNEMRSFLRQVRPLVCVLIDSRLPPQRIDLAWVAELQQQGLSYAILATKADALNQSLRHRQQRLLLAAFPGALRLSLVSARTGEGIGELKTWLQSYLFS